MSGIPLRAEPCSTFAWRSRWATALLAAVVPAGAAAQMERGPFLPRPEPAAARVAGQAAAAQFTGFIPVSGGTQLAFTAWLPSLSGRYPVVLTLTPYGRTAFAGWAQVFNPRGLGFVAVDVRGRYDSGGAWEPLLPHGDDGRDVIAWIAAQTWCTGKVATNGGSQDAWYQLLTAIRRPPALVAMLPAVCPPDPFDNLPFNQGALLLPEVQWALQNRGRTYLPNALSGVDVLSIVRTYPITAWDDRAGLPTPFFDAWIDHWRWDDYWEARSYESRIADVEVPALVLTGWFDGDQPGGIRVFQALRNDPDPRVREATKLIVGPWYHQLVPPPFGELSFPGNNARDLNAIAADWFANHLLGAGDGQGAPVEYYLMGRNAWLEATAWPPAEARRLELLAGPGGVLQAAASVAGADSFDYDPAAPTPVLEPLTPDTAWQAYSHFPLDATALIGRDDVLLYAGPPLSDPLAVAGPVAAEVWFSSTAEDTDVAIWLLDLAPDGKAVTLQTGIARARFRNGYAVEVPLPPGQPVKIVVDLWSTAYEFPRGHRVGMLVASAQFPAFDVHRNLFDDLAHGTAMTTATQTVHYGEATPTRLLLWTLPRAPRRHLGR